MTGPTSLLFVWSIQKLAVRVSPVSRSTPVDVHMADNYSTPGTGVPLSDVMGNTQLWLVGFLFIRRFSKVDFVSMTERGGLISFLEVLFQLKTETPSCSLGLGL